MMRQLALACGLTALAGCQQGGTPPQASDVVSRPAARASVSAAPMPTGTTTTAGTLEFGIPVALQGNWGLAPGDCTSTGGDAKGLLRVSGTTLTFYESTGQLGTVKERGDSAIRAEFAFTGEGMSWTRDVELSVTGDTLTRTETGGEEPGGPFTYTRCAG